MLNTLVFDVLMVLGLGILFYIPLYLMLKIRFIPYFYGLLFGFFLIEFLKILSVR